jgi:hypothetical protein
MFEKTRRGMWIDETLEVAMDVIERGTHSLRKASRSWNLPMNSLVDHLHGETKFKKLGLGSVLIEEEYVIMITWTLAMQERGLSISLQQLKMIVRELTQTRAISFRDGITCNSWWYWFKHKRPKVNIQ